MEQRHLILIDEQSQADRLARITEILRNDGIELVYKEINPQDYISRREDGDVFLDNEKLRQHLRSIPFLTHLDVFATDYNLIDDELKGIDVISMLYDLLPYYCKQVVMYSAQIEEVIDNIINRVSEFEEKVRMLKVLSKNEITFLSSLGEFENKFKQLIEKEINISIDDRLATSLCALDNDKFMCNLPDYTDKKISEIGDKLRKNNSETITLRKEITEQILAYITAIHDYE